MLWGLGLQGYRAVGFRVLGFGVVFGCRVGGPKVENILSTPKKGLALGFEGT